MRVLFARRFIYAAVVALTTFVNCRVAQAQVLRGVAITASQQPVSGAVINLSDSYGHTVGRAMSSADGYFAINAPERGNYTVTFLRIGHRPSTFADIILDSGFSSLRRFVLSGAPVLLDTFRIVSNATCQRTESSKTALVVWEQIRIAIAATTISALRDSTIVRLLTYERELDRSGERVLSQTSTLKARVADEPWQTASVESLRSDGYVRSVKDTVAYFAPGLETLAADSFLADHCLSLVASVDSTLVTIAFEPIRTNLGVVGIRGEFDVHAASQTLKVLRFWYTNVGRERAQRAGGEMHFARLRDGTWAIAEWMLRMPVVRGTQRRDYSAKDSVTTAVYVRGGQLVLLARANDTLFAKREQVFRGTVSDADGHLVAGAYLELPGTEFAAVADSNGEAFLRNLIPGHYTLRAHTPLLDRLGLVSQSDVTMSPSDLSFNVQVPSETSLLRALCGAKGERNGVIIGSLQRAEKTLEIPTLVNAEWESTRSNLDLSAVRHRERTLSDSAGRFWICGLPLQTDVIVQVSSDSLRSAPLVVNLAQNRFAFSVVQIDSDTPHGSTLLATVVDSQLKPIAEAEILLPALSKTQRSEVSGHVRITDIPTGSQRVIVRKVGFEPLDTQLPFTAPTTERKFVLTRLAVLDSVKIVAERQRVRTGFEAFEERRSLGFGKFIPYVDIIKNEQRRLDGFVREVPGVLIGSPPKCSSRDKCGTPAPSGMIVAKGRSGCMMRVLVDGVEMAHTGANAEAAFDLRSIPLINIEAVEVYRSKFETPHEFLDSAAWGDCGTLVIWTRKFHNYRESPSNSQV